MIWEMYIQQTNWFSPLVINCCWNEQVAKILDLILKILMAWQKWGMIFYLFFPLVLNLFWYCIEDLEFWMNYTFPMDCLLGLKWNLCVHWPFQYMDYKWIGYKEEEKLDRILKETVLNATKAPASGLGAQSFIKQVLLPLFPHSSWGEASWPCIINHKASEPSLCSIAREECLHAYGLATPMEYLKYRPWAIIIWGRVLFSRAAIFLLVHGNTFWETTGKLNQIWRARNEVTPVKLGKFPIMQGWKSHKK